MDHAAEVRGNWQLIKKGPLTFLGDCIIIYQGLLRRSLFVALLLGPRCAERSHGLDDEIDVLLDIQFTYR